MPNDFICPVLKRFFPFAKGKSSSLTVIVDVFFSVLIPVGLDCVFTVT